MDEQDWTWGEKTALRLRAASALLAAGFTDQEVRSVLGTFALQVATSHARREAWLAKEAAQKVALASGEITFGDLPADELELTTRAARMVEEAGFKTVREVAAQPEEWWLAREGCGKKTAREIVEEAAKFLSEGPWRWRSPA